MRPSETQSTHLYARAIYLSGTSAGNPFKTSRAMRNDAAVLQKKPDAVRQKLPP